MYFDRMEWLLRRLAIGVDLVWVTTEKMLAKIFVVIGPPVPSAKALCRRVDHKMPILIAHLL